MYATKLSVCQRDAALETYLQNLIKEEQSNSKKHSASKDEYQQYLSQISNYTLLSAEEEQWLAGRIQSARQAIKEAVIHLESADILLKDLIEMLLEDPSKRDCYLSNEGQVSAHIYRNRLESAWIELKQNPNPSQLKQLAEDLGLTTQAYIHMGEHSQNESEKLKKLVDEYEFCFQQFVQANLKLVVSVAHKHYRSGLVLMDMIQEGNLGLIKAVERFNPELGFRFSTYAVWWIRRAIMHNLVRQNESIRVPDNVYRNRKKLAVARAECVQETATVPTEETVRIRSGLSKKTVNRVNRIQEKALSLDAPLGGDQDSSYHEIMADSAQANPQTEVFLKLTREEIDRLFECLSLREQEMLRLRFGLEDGVQRTLEEVGKKFGISRERVRQIEERAMRRLRHPSRSQRLRLYKKLLDEKDTTEKVSSFSMN